MIYFLDNSLQLQKIVTSKNIISAIHEHELNGLIRADVELDLSYANKFLVLGIDHVGYYYKDEFYLHKIQRVEYDHVNESAKVVLRHIFFEDMIFGKLIQDVRPQNQDALTVSRQTIDANTRWKTIMTDVTGRLSTNFYWQVPYEVIEFMTKNYRIEYLPKILFDGQKINGFQLHLANKIGEDKNIRIPYGSRVLDLKYEEDFSEIITKLVVHGKGEEVGDGYGRRINISDVNFSRNGVKSPVGSLYLEDESITNTYGNDGQTPREGIEVFEDIEDANELAEAGYQHYLQVSRPQMLFTADVADIGDVGIGDSVMIIRREYDVYFNARIHKLSVDLLYPEDAQVELGDYDHFKESKVERKTREKNNRVQGQLSDRITRLKLEANERFDNEVAQWKSEYEQALIDAHAQIEADRENMTNLIEGTRIEFTDNLIAEISQSKEYAEQQAQEKAESVQTNLDSFKNSHQQLYDEVTGNLSQTRSDLLERINNIDTQSFNLIRGSRFDEPDRYATSGGTVHDDEDMPYFRYGISSGNIQYIATVDDIQFESGKTYALSLDYRTSSNVVIDYLRIIATDGSANVDIRNYITEQDMAGIIADDNWHRTFLTFTVPRNLTGTLRIGSDFSTSVKGQTDIRLPYLTTSGNTQWVFHPSDSYESIISVMSRIDEFEQSVWAELEGVYGNLSSTRTDLQKQLDDARAELEGLEVGGRNLLLEQKRTSFPTTYEASITSKEIIEDNNLPSGWYLRFNNWSPSSGSSSFYFNPAGSHLSEPLTGKRITMSMLVRSDVPFTFHGTEVTNEWKKVIRTIRNVPSGNIHWYINKKATIDISSIKIEKGNIATDWTPAPEDTEQKITTLNQQIEYIDGQLSAKLEQTDIDPINNKITEYGNSLTANAQSIESLIDKTELHDGDITKWSNQTIANAEGIERRLTKAEYTTDKATLDADITQWSNLTTETAEGLEQTIGRVSTAEGKLSNAEFVIKANADSLKLTATKTEVENAIEGIEVGGRNLILNSSHLSEPREAVAGRNTLITNEYNHLEYITYSDVNAGYLFQFSKILEVGEEYTLTFDIYSMESASINYLYLRRLVTETDYGNMSQRLPDQSLVEGLNSIEIKVKITNSGINGIWIGSNNTSEKHFVLSNLQIEKGNKATDWTPALEDIDASISEVTDRVTTAEAELVVHAGEISQKATQSEVDRVTGRVSTAETSITQNAKEIARRLVKTDYDSDKAQTDTAITEWSNLSTETAEGLEQTIGRVSTAEGKLSNAEFTIKSNADSLKLTATKTEVEQAIEGIEVGGRNLLLERKTTSFPPTYDASIASKEIIEDNNLPSGWYLRFNNWSPTGSLPSFFFNADSPYFTESLTGKNITFSMLVRSDVPFTFHGTEVTDEWKKVIRTIRNVPGANIHWYIREKATVDISSIKVEKGNKATDWSPAPEDTDAKISKVSSDLEIEAGRIVGLVSDISEDYVKQSSVKVTSDRVTIGSTIVNGSTIGSVLSVSPTGIDAVAGAMKLSGDLLVAGDVSALAVKAIEGDFARLFASSLTANVIKSNHIQTDTALAKKLFATNANIDELITRTHFSNSIKTLSLEAVDANIGDLRTKILEADVINARHVNFTDALVRGIYAHEAFIANATIQAANIRDLDAISIHANTFSSSIPGSNREITMENGRARFRYGSIVIENISGRRTIIDGQINRSQTMTARMPRFQSSAVVEDGSWYRTNSTSYEIAHEEYFIHEARHIRVAMAVHRWGMSAWCDGRMETRSGKVSNFITTENDSSAVYDWLKIDMGEPLDRPVSDSLIYTFKTRSSEQAKRMHLGNRFLTDFPENL